MKKVELYTDGACSGNPGKGGYGGILKYGDTERSFSQGYRRTTNNRMELLAAIVGLEMLNQVCEVDLYSDSKYLVDAVEKGWVYGWKKKGWKKSDGKPALNVDLWQRLLVQLARHNVKLIWVKGHAGNPNNERCDKMAVAASAGSNLAEDVGYEKG